MLQCNLCNYLKKSNSAKGCGVHYTCEITGFEFKMDIEEYEIEYPCNDKELDLSKANIDIPNKIISERVILSENWRYQYKKAHLRRCEDKVKVCS